MVEADGLVGKGAGEIDDIAQLRLENPCIEGQAHLAEMREPFPKTGAAIEAFRRVEGRAEDFGIGIPGALVADALEPAIAGCDQSLQDRCGPVAQHHVGMADNACTGAVISVETARRLRRDAVHILDLAHDLHVLVPVEVVEGAAFHEDRGDDVVAGVGVGLQRVEIVIRFLRDGSDEGVLRVGNAGTIGRRSTDGGADR